MFSAGGQLVVTGGQNYEKKLFITVDGQTSHENLSSQLLNLPSVEHLMNPQVCSLWCCRLSSLKMIRALDWNVAIASRFSTYFKVNFIASGQRQFLQINWFQVLTSHS